MAGSSPRFVVGERDGRSSDRIERLVEARRSAGVDCTLTDDISRAIWEKFVFLSAFSGTTSLCRLPIGPIRADEDARALFEAAVAEAVAVARASGVELLADAAARTMAFTDGLPEDMTSSMHRDLQAGHRLELPG